VGFDQVSFAVPYLARVPILEGQREERAQRYRWFQIEHQGQRGWLREDFVTYEGDTSALDLPTDLYPSPMTLEQYWWVRGFNYPPDIDTSTFEHWGWDQGANTGEPVPCGPKGGLVVRSFQCRNCTPDRPSVLQHGLRLGDPRIFEDEGWGFGYGNFVIVRYLSDQLPESTQDALTARDFRGGHLFVMYAHLEKRQVEAGDELTRGQPIGTCGNTGNSEATHLHLEVRASRSENFSHWAALKDGLLDPVVLFRR
jgi:hypothetical protein